MSQSTQTLHGKTALLTGAARRLGATIARAFHAHGANVVIHHRSSSTSEAADALVAELNAIRANSASAIAADLLNVASLPSLVAGTVERFGRLDILVNNASTFYPTPVGDITLAHWDDLMGSNLRAPLFLSQAAAQQLRLHEGLILNMIDIHAERPLKRHPVYCSAKAGLAMLTRSLARELAPHVRVNGIAPGPVLWPEVDIDEHLKERIIDRTALKRPG
ncbi:MAG: pteridine reductase, partial [Steroidobacteraceae bacterium]|nr:pteridine reductase [Steroidobacteraceae bacterium]